MYFILNTITYLIVFSIIAAGIAFFFQAPVLSIFVGIIIAAYLAHCDSQTYH